MDSASFEGRIQKLKIPKRQQQLLHIEKLTKIAKWSSDKPKNIHSSRATSPLLSKCSSEIIENTVSSDIEKDILTKKDVILKPMRDAFYIPSAVGKTVTTSKFNDDGIFLKDHIEIGRNKEDEPEPKLAPRIAAAETNYIDFNDTKTLQEQMSNDPIIWLTDFADTIEQHKKATYAALSFSDQMHDAIQENIKDILILKDKIAETVTQEQEAGHTVEGDRERLNALQTGMEGKEKQLIEATERRKRAEEAFKKAKEEFKLAEDYETKIKETVRDEKLELAILEKRVLRFGIQLTDGLTFCNNKIDEADRKFQLARALQQYSLQAKKYLDETICSDKNGALTQMINRIQTFMKEVKERGEHLNVFAVKYAIELLCQVWGESEESNVPSIIMETIKSMDNTIFASNSTLPSSLSVVTASAPLIDYDILQTVVYYHRGVYLHANHYVEQTKRVINCLKALRENQTSNRNGQTVVFNIDEIDLLNTEHLPTARILRLVHAGSYIKRIHDVAESASKCSVQNHLQCNNVNTINQQIMASTTTTTFSDKKSNSTDEGTVVEMEASDDEFIGFDVSTSLISPEDEEKANGIWKIIGNKYGDDHSSKPDTNNTKNNGFSSSSDHFRVHKPQSSQVKEEVSENEPVQKNNINPLTGKRYYRRRTVKQVDVAANNTSGHTIPKATRQRRTPALNIKTMIHFGIVKPGPIKIIYRGHVVTEGVLNNDSSFSCGDNTFDTPSGFALHYIRKCSNPNITTISGYMAIYQGDYSLDALRKSYMKSNGTQINALKSNAVNDQSLVKNVNKILDEKINHLKHAHNRNLGTDNAPALSRFPRSRTAITNDLSLRNMMKHGFVKPQPITVFYHQAHRTGGRITASGHFEVDGESWETPSGFALYIAKKVNPNLRTINGFSAVRINNVKLAVYRDKFKLYIEEKKRRLASADEKSVMPILEKTVPAVDTTSILNNSNVGEAMSISEDDEKNDTVNGLNTSSSSFGTTACNSSSGSNNGNTITATMATTANNSVNNIISSESDKATVSASNNTRQRGYSNNSSAPMDEFKNIITPTNNFILDDEDNSVTSLSGGLEFWLSLGGKLTGLEKGCYIEKMCRVNEDKVAWLPASIVRKISDTEYKIKFVHEFIGARSFKLSSYLDVSLDVWKKDKKVAEDERNNADGKGRGSRRRKKVPSRYRDIPLDQKQLATSRKRSVSVSSTNSASGSTTGNYNTKKRKRSTSWNNKNGYKCGNEGDDDDEQDSSLDGGESNGNGTLDELQNLLEVTEDTVLSNRSHIACLHAAGVVCKAVDSVMAPTNQRTVRNAFCLVRPPGHHVGRFGRTVGCCSHGFCLMNNVGIGAMKARVDHGCKKVAIIDFDVHFGNGTYEIFRMDKDTMFISVHMTGDAEGNVFFGANLPGVDEIDTIFNNVCISLEGGKGSKGRTRFSSAFLNTVLPALRSFNPELILISAGFDGHKDDPLGGHLGLIVKDFRELTYHIVQLAEEPNMACQGRVVSVLEGGYDCKPQGSLPKCVVAHVKALAEKKPIFDQKWKKNLVIGTTFPPSSVLTAMDGGSRKRNRSRRIDLNRKFSPGAVSLRSPTKSPQNMMSRDRRHSQCRGGCRSNGECSSQKRAKFDVFEV